MKGPCHSESLRFASRAEKSQTARTVRVSPNVAGTLLMPRPISGIQLEVQFEDVDAGFTQEPPLTSGGVFEDQGPDLCLGGFARARYPRNLIFGRSRRNVGIQSRT